MSLRQFLQNSVAFADARGEGTEIAAHCFRMVLSGSSQENSVERSSGNSEPNDPLDVVHDLYRQVFLRGLDPQLPGPLGFTCCHLPDLSNRVEAFHERIDYVMARGLTGPGGNLLGRVAVVGDEPSTSLID